MTGTNVDGNGIPSRTTVRVVQCWDDGVTDDIRLTEILRRHRARATFNLNIGLHAPARGGGWRFQNRKDVERLALPELRSVYEGFTIANHTRSHPWLTRIAPEAALAEIREGRDQLEQHFGKPALGFAYPFGDVNEIVAELVREAGHCYARTCGTGFPVSPPADPMLLHPSCHFLSPAFWEHFERERDAGGVFYFWGHSYELVTEEDWNAFENKIQRLSSDESTVWSDLPSLFQ